MSGTLAVVTVYKGREIQSAGFDQAEADWVAGSVADLGGWDSGPVIRDLLPDLEARFPVGTPVWLGKRVHWRRGQAGTVTAGEPESHARWFPSNLAPWFISADGPSVHVLLDDSYESWWPVSWLETR